jgi:protein-S-isoprenylcysteine O-methyltransferase Ste14
LSFHISSNTIFPSEIAAIGFIVMICAFIIAEIAGAIFTSVKRGGIRTGRRRMRVGGSLVAWGLVGLSWMYVFVAVLVVAAMGYGLMPTWFCYIGIIVMAVGIAIRMWAVTVLGRYFSRTLDVEPKQKVVEAGPYRYVRHPSYTGVLLFFVGMGLAVSSWVAVIIGVLVFAVAYGYWMYSEEKVLVQKLGSCYVDYMKRVKRIVPKIV